MAPTGAVFHLLPFYVADLELFSWASIAALFAGHLSHPLVLTLILLIQELLKIPEVFLHVIFVKVSVVVVLQVEFVRTYRLLFQLVILFKLLLNIELGEFVSEQLILPESWYIETHGLHSMNDLILNGVSCLSKLPDRVDRSVLGVHG